MRVIELKKPLLLTDESEERIEKDMAIMSAERGMLYVDRSEEGKAAIERMKRRHAKKELRGDWCGTAKASQWFSERFSKK
jgi:hypothetical protein